LALNNALAGDPDAATIQVAKAKAEAKLRRLKSDGARDTEGAVLTAKDNIKQATQELAKLREELRGKLTKELHTKARADYKDRLEQLEGQVETLAKKHKETSELAERLTRDTENLGQTDAKYELARKAVKQEEAENDLLNRRFKNQEMELNAEPRV